MVTRLISLGDKVDVYKLYQKEQEQQQDFLKNIYKSQVNDITEDGKLEITMPIENGKVILLPLDIRFELVFYTNSGLYHSIGQVRERYKKDNIYVMVIDLHTRLKKIQRREFYRYPCLLDVHFYPVSETDAKEKTVEQIVRELRDDGLSDVEMRARVVDLSGGGARFIGKEKLEQDSYILLVLRLNNEQRDKQYCIKCQVLMSEELTNQREKVESRIQFVFQDVRIQEEIIQYIFEEERRDRRNS